MMKEVLRIQNYLRQISQEYPQIPEVKTDGVFSDEMTQAIKEFQRFFGIHADGVVGYETWRKIVSIYQSIKRTRELPLEVQFFNQSRIFEKHGDEGDYVYVLQIMLKALARNFEDVYDTMITGILDSETRFAVKKFQERTYLIPTGTVDKKTWDTLVKSYEAYR